MATEKTPTLPRTLSKKAQTKSVYAKYQKGGQVPNQTIPTQNIAIRDLRTETVPATALRLLSRKNGNVGASVFSFVEIAKSGFTVRAYDTNTNTYNSQATEAAKSLLAAFDTVYDYTAGYADVMTMDAVVETMLREVLLTNFVGAELVLDKARIPSRIVPAPFESIVWKSRGDGTKYPAQIGTFTGEEEISLDIATFWTATLHQDLTATYATPMLEPAIDMAIYYSEFIEDMRRATRRTGHSRLVITLNAEKIQAAAPAEVKEDSAKLQAFMEDQLTTVSDLVKSMEPEDALITYDAVDSNEMQTKSVKADYTALLTAISGLLATSLKSHPSILGLRMEGSQSLSNTESLVFLKIAKGIQRPVADILSRALTLAVRLVGIDAYVKFKFKPINLRPEDELEAYRTMQQTRILEQLSLGFITDDQAAELLGTGSRPPGAPELSGTMFLDNTEKQSAADAVSTNQDPQGRALTPDTPAKGGGKSQ